MWEIIGNISSVCSIIGFPLALWQIYGLKSRVEATEKGIRSVLDIKEHEKLGQIFGTLAAQYQQICDLISQVNKSGKSAPSIIKKCQTINKQIGTYYIELLSQYAGISMNLKRTMEHIEKYIESDMKGNDELKEARDYLNNALQQIKQEEKVFEDKTISMAARSNGATK